MRGGTESARLIAFICECGSTSCHRTVPLTLEEHEQRRPGLMVHADHDAVVRNLIECAS